jgi:hypothetical protein
MLLAYFFNNINKKKNVFFTSVKETCHFLKVGLYELLQSNLYEINTYIYYSKISVKSSI